MRPQVCRLEDGPHLTMGAPWLQTSNLQNWELYIPGVYKPPRLWCFLMAVQSTKKTSNACPLWASTERSSIHPRVLCSGERKAALHTHGYSLRAIICFQIVSIVSEGKYGKHRKVQRIWSHLKPHHSELQMTTEEGRSLAKGWPQASPLHWHCHLRPVIWLLGISVLSSLKGGHYMDEF